MNLLNRYILRQFIKNIATITLSFISIYLLVDFFEKVDDFIEKGKPMVLLIKFFLLNVPFILEQVGPVCILLAGVLTLGILNHSNELIGLKACGIPLRKITTPIIGAGLFCTMILLAMSQFVLPRTIAETNRIWHKEVKGRIPLGIYRNGRYYYKGEDGFYSFSRPDPKRNEFHFFSYASWTPQYRLNALVTARIATWQDGTWTLNKGQIQVDKPEKISKDQKQNFSTQLFTQTTAPFQETPEKFFVPEYHAEEMSLLELYRETQKQSSQGKQNKALTDFYRKVSYASLGLPLLILGLPMVLLVYRKWGRDLSIAIPASCGMAFCCWGAWGTLQSLAKTGYIPPLAAALSIHCLMIVAGLLFLIREES